MPVKRRTTGRRNQRAKAYVIARDDGVCALCGHPGADTLGHILPVATHPHLEWTPDNWQAEHGRRRTRSRDGYDCPGNYASGSRIAAMVMAQQMLADQGMVMPQPQDSLPRRGPGGIGPAGSPAGPAGSPVRHQPDPPRIY